MPIAIWRDDYRTGNKQVDEQHQQLFAIANRLHDAMMKGHGKEVLKDTLDELIEYTIKHFKDEEEMMTTYNYPDYISHHNIHQQLTQKVIALNEKFKQKPSTHLAIELAQFLTDWLINHIKREDIKMINYLKDQPNKINP